MMSFGPWCVILLLGSVAFFVPAMLLTARPRMGASAGSQRRRAASIGLLGLASGASLGGAATWGRSAMASVVAALVLGLVMGVAVAGVSWQVWWVLRRLQRDPRGDSMGDSPPSDEPA